MIHTLFDREIIVRRSKTISGYKKGFSSTATVEGHMQPVGNDTREGLPNVDTKEHVLFCPVDANIKKGDKLEVKIKDSTGFVRDTQYFHVTSVQYRVEGLTGISEHLEVQADKLNQS